MSRKSLSTALKDFSADWLANPVAALEFAKLIELVLVVGNAGGDTLRDDYRSVRAWIAEEKRAAKSIGIE